MSDLKRFVPSKSFRFPEGTITRFLSGIAETIPAAEAELLDAKGLGTIEGDVAGAAAAAVLQNTDPALRPAEPSQDG